MPVNVKRIPVKGYLFFEPGSDGQCNLDRRQVLGADRSDWRSTEAIESNTLNGSCRFGRETLAPEPHQEPCRCETAARHACLAFNGVPKLGPTPFYLPKSSWTKVYPTMASTVIELTLQNVARMSCSCAVT